MRNTSIGRLVSLSALMAGLYAAPASAQEAPGESVQDEIVVTARFRAERVQDVSQSISALSGAALEERGLTDLSDIANATPGFELVDRGPSRKSPNIRGVGRLVQLDDFVQSSPTVGMYLDEVPYSTVFANQRDVPAFDLQGVEVLRGPQGTLYGEGSMAGTVKFNTARPDASRFSARTLNTLSFTEDGGTNYALNGAVNLPLVQDKVALRIVGFKEHDDGFIDRAIAGQAVTEDANDSERHGGRALLRAELGERLSVQGGFYYDKTESGASWVTGFNRVDDLVNDTRPGPESRDDEYKMMSFRADYDFDFGVLTSITSFTKRSSDFTFKDQVNTRVLIPALPPKTSPAYAGLLFQNIGFTRDETLTQELRFVSAFDGPFNFTLGGYYRESDTDLGSIFFLNPAAPAIDNNFIGDGQQYAVFGEASYDITDRLTGRLGARYFTETLLTRSIFRAPASLAAIPLPNQKNDITATLPRLSFEYDWLEDALLYVSAASGARNGGFNSALVATQENQRATIAGQPPTYASFDAISAYDNDEVWTYELGLKSQWLDRRLTLNAAAFYTDWKDLQIRTLTPVAGITLFGNVGKAHIAGVEFEGAFDLTETLTLSIGAALQEAETDEDIIYRPGVPALGLPTLIAPSGTPLPGARDTAFTAALDYEQPIGGDWSVFGRVDYSYLSETTNELAFDAGFPVAGFANDLPSYDIFNVRAGVKRDGLSLTLFADNVANEVVAQGVLPRSDETYVNRPRTIGVTLAAEF